MKISIVIVRALVHELLRRGVDATAVMTSAGVDSTLLDDPTARLCFDDYNRIVGRALEVTGDPQLGLYVGARTPAAALTVLGHLVTTTSTIREAAAAFIRYSPLIVEGARWDIGERDGVAIVGCELPTGLIHREYGYEVCLALVHVVLGTLFTTDLPLFAVRFAHSPTGPVDTYRTIFGTEVRFDAGENAFRGPAEILDRRQLYADASICELLRSRADALLADLQAPDRLPSRLRDYIQTSENPSNLTATTLAEVVGMTERTLRRRLGEQGLTVRELLETTLSAMARNALEDRNASIKEICFRLGFSNASSFHRAFKRWTQMTPATYREEARLARCG